MYNEQEEREDNVANENRWAEQDEVWEHILNLGIDPTTGRQMVPRQVNHLVVNQHEQDPGVEEETHNMNTE